MLSKCYWTNYNNEEAVSLLHEAQTVKEDSEREEIYEQLQQILADDVPYIPLYEPEIIVGMGSDVNGLEILPNGSVRFENVTIGE
jgi:peptide/nickel transport system substrate-binding protein